MANAFRASLQSLALLGKAFETGLCLHAQHVAGSALAFSLQNFVNVCPVCLICILWPQAQFYLRTNLLAMCDMLPRVSEECSFSGKA